MSALNDAPVRIPQPAATLGYAGALPFVLAAAAIWMLDPAWRDEVHLIMVGFSAVILSFMGGVRWGLAMVGARGPSYLQLIISIVPAFAAWAVLLVPLILPANIDRSAQLVVLIAGFLGLLWSDIQATRRGEAPQWYPGLRVPLTFLVVTSLFAALIRTLI